MRRLAAALCGVLLLAGCGNDSTTSTKAPAPTPPSSTAPTSSTEPAQPSTSPTTPASTPPTATPTTPAAEPANQVDKILVFVVENHSLEQMRDGMPWTYDLATRYGHATNFFALTHPSLPNYIAMAGGDMMGVRDDNPPAQHRLRGPSVFGQAIASGRTAGTYAEGMGRNCAGDPAGRYAPKHNPWAYFVDEAAACQKYDVPLTRLDADVAAGKLPAVGMVIPDLCNDAHDCDLGAADRWMRAVVGKVMSGPDWAGGHLAIVITADEDDRNHDNRILTAVLHPALNRVVVDKRLDHYALSRALSEVGGSAPLRQAANAPSLLEAFGLRAG